MLVLEGYGLFIKILYVYINVYIFGFLVCLFWVVNWFWINMDLFDVNVIGICMFIVD